ncbi:MAG: hypothetical protein DYG96_11970, partial [Chlorobi bacterium CHB2]|nr:hypothetical protein [Chlorobi bacterium CHB2]
MPTAQHADLDEQIKNINAQLRAGGADILAAIEEAWGTALRADYRPGMAQLRWLHACYHFMRANYADALRLAEESRQLFRTVDRPIELARCLNTIASCHLSLGDPAHALQFFLESRELATRRREANPTLADSLLSSLLNNIALVYDSLGDVEKALELFRENLERKREAGDRAGMLFALNNMVLWGMGIALGLTGLAGWVWSGWRLLRGRDGALRNLLLVVWFLVYFGWLGRNWVATMRYFLPLYPVMALLAAWLLMELLRRTQTMPLRRLLAGGLAAFVVGFTLLWAGMFTNIYRHQL